jgi:hypothetical protein
MNTKEQTTLKPIPRYLYHGTTEHALGAALMGEGLKPRSASGVTNWDAPIESDPHAVYLTTAYPLHFAINAMGDEKLANSAVVEVDTWMLQGTKFQADEDAIEQCKRGHDELPKDWTMEQRTRWYRNRAHKYSAQASLALLGTCAYRGTIGPEAITRAAVFTRKQAVWMTAHVFDPTITVQNYRFCGAMHEKNVAWLFGDGPFNHWGLRLGIPIEPPKRPEFTIINVRQQKEAA